MKPKEIYEVLLEEKGKSTDYSEFKQLSDYQKKRLYNVNYWRVQAGEKTIPIPEEFTSYWEELKNNYEACLDEE
ncbi:hypothetical protein V6R21_17055 [Limibacter armeniacum]|uniref:hypothetical protein n=1 Tax=Limibacter armeniacum TaxID=466084 RepID=UPI002FE528F7